jgi:hypothetical protein
VNGGVGGNLTNNATTFVGPYLSPGNGDPTEANVAVKLVGSATFGSLHVEVGGAPGSGKTWTFTLRDNTTDTSLSCAITGAATSCTVASSVTIPAGDTIDLKSVPSGAPPAKPMGWVAGG